MLSLRVYLEAVGLVSQFQIQSTLIIITYIPQAANKYRYQSYCLILCKWRLVYIYTWRGLLKLGSPRKCRLLVSFLFFSKMVDSKYTCERQYGRSEFNLHSRLLQSIRYRSVYIYPQEYTKRARVTALTLDFHPQTLYTSSYCIVAWLRIGAAAWLRNCKPSRGTGDNISSRGPG